MDLLLSVIYFLPCIICVVWMFIYIFRVKNTTQKMMLAMLVMGGFYFTTYAFYISPSTDYHVMAYLDTFNVPVSLVILAVNLVFVWTHQNRQLLDSRRHPLLYIPVLVLSSVNFIIVYLIGVDGLARFAEALDRSEGYPPGFDDPLFELYYQFNIHFLNYVLLAYILVIIYSCFRLSRRHGYRVGDVFRFFFSANESNPMRVVCFLDVLTLCLLVPMVPMGGLGRSFLLNHPAVGSTLTLLLSVALFCLCYVEYMIDLPQFTLSSLSHVDMAKPEPPDAQPVVRNEERERIEAALRKAFDQERVYVDPELSIISLASRLGTNRTTLSLIIVQAFGVNFRQLLARYRIEAAKCYMLERPEAKQDEVALECGFATAQAFNQKFKELVGESPRMWMVKQKTENT